MKQLKHAITQAYNKNQLLYNVRVTINHHSRERDFLMLFDTGASLVGIRQEAFNALGIAIDQTTPTVTALGLAQMKSGIAQSITLDGAITVYGVRVNILPSSFFQAARTQNVTGVLGGSFLSRIKFFMGQGFIRVYQDVNQDVGYY